MFPVLLLAQLSVAAPNPDYSSAALRDLVARAVIANRAPPPELRGYRARVETEFSLSLRDTLGRERAGQIEQLASRVEWTRDGSYDMHVVGYRSQSLGSPVSTLSFVHGWTEPTLYGDRLQLALLLYAQWLSAQVRNGYATDFELHPASLAGIVAERQVADDAVPGAGEAEGDLLDDIQRSIGVHRKEHSEVANANSAVAVLRACIVPNREGERDGEEECPANG